MKIESSLSNKSLLLIQGCLFTFISLLFLKSAISSYLLAGIVGLAVVGLLIFKFPSLVFPAFIISLFWGHLFYRTTEFGVTISDPIFVLSFIAYISTVINPKINRSQTDNNSKTLTIFFILLIASLILSLLVNASVLPDRYLCFGAVKSAYMIQYLLAFVMVNWLYFPDKGQKILNFIYLLSLLQFPIALYQFFFTGGLSSDEINRDIIGSMSYHHGMLGTFMLIPFFLTIGQARISQRKALRVGYWAMAIVFLFLVILSGTRSALVGLFISAAIFMVLNLKLRRNNLKYVFLLLLAAIAVYYMTPVKHLVNATFNGSSNMVDISSLGRLLMWESALSYFISSDLLQKLFGVGFGCFFLIPQKYVVFDGLRHSFGAHNNFLNILCETGIIGLASFVTFFIIALRILYKRKHPLALSFFYATIALLFSGITQETFWVTTAFHNLWLFYMVIFALILKISNIQE